MTRRLATVLIALLALVSMTGCGDDDSPSVSPSPGAATAMPSEPVPTPTVTPTATQAVPPEGYPITQRTGIAEVDLVLDALASKDEARIRALFVETLSPCVVNPENITNPPLCPPGVPAGALVPVFRATACEAVWPDYMPTAMRFWLKQNQRIYTVVRDVPEMYSWLPAADHEIVFDDPDSWASFVRVSGGKITGWAFGCGQQPEKLLEGVSPSQYILPPPTR